MNLRLRVRRRVAMGLSLVAGWGCFIMEDVPKGAFIVRADLCSPVGVPVFMPPRTKSGLASATRSRLGCGPTDQLTEEQHILQPSK